jgi:hypothetical protein
MNQFEQLVKCLGRYESSGWTNQYFDIVKKLLTDLRVDNDDPRLAITLTKNLDININIGQRYVLQQGYNHQFRCIVPVSFPEESINAALMGYFTRNRIKDAKWIEINYPDGAWLAPLLYNNIIEACSDILLRAKKSGFRKLHVPLIYDFIMYPETRNEILGEVTHDRHSVTREK